MSNPFASIWDDRPAPPTVEKPKPTAPKPRPVVDHTVSKALYRRYLARAAELSPHREYAHLIARATAGPSMTPVRPLAVMGCGGGPLLCDHCGKPIPLEGGAFNNVPAPEAWAKRTDRPDNWLSYIKGGLIVEIACNGTLRIYHGYERNEKDCCQVAKRRNDAAEAAWARPATPDLNALRRFLREEFPEHTDRELNAIIGDVMTTLFSYDPGIGVNRPG